MKNQKIDLNLKSRILISPFKLCTLFFASCLSNTQRAGQIAQYAFPSIVLVAMEDINHQPFSSGRGFVAKEDIIATNLHVVEGAPFDQMITFYPFEEISKAVEDMEKGKVLKPALHP
jgi:Zn-dependent alcohol dehydrogenase